ncbi:MAG: hypothetical protein K2X56_11045 [Mycobacterium pseudokansasii]|nr:hypothetical protein [Mycobacterium pseudokansasii]
MRSLQTILVFAKALAYFRGTRIVAIDDVRHILPFVLVNRLAQDRDAPFSRWRATPPTEPTESAGSVGCSSCPAPNTTSRDSTPTIRWSICSPSSSWASTASPSARCAIDWSASSAQ